MPVMHNAVRTLCAAYFAVSLAVAGITLHAMWDSFVNREVRLELVGGNIDGGQASQTTVSVLSTSTSKVIICSAVSEDGSPATLFAGSSVFTAAMQNGTSLCLCNQDGAACFMFACEAHLGHFVGAIETE